ncbi:MAG: proton-conducting transporter membrane subunit, partial [Cyanobacteria bacterium P01_A01_bin.15]
MTSAITTTIVWMVVPLFLGFSGYLVPQLGRVFALSVALLSLGYGLGHIIEPSVLSWQLLDSFGVSLRVDSLSGYFIVTNALVTAAVVMYCWQQGKTAFFYAQVTLLHGSMNAIFICNDFISLYVALEVISIAVFLLIAYPRDDRSIWIGLRYLFISNTAMLFYLIGAVLVYQTSNSFAFAGLEGAPYEGLALIFLGLLTKGGVFVSGLW